MVDQLRLFESIARRAHRHTDIDAVEEASQHPFDIRAVHETIVSVAQGLFDDGYYAQATFEAYKYIDKLIQKLSGSTESGFKLMMATLSETSPSIGLTGCTTESEKNEQKGYQFLFAGSVLAIRNPRGHEVNLADAPDTCLDHLSLASLLLRRLEQAGYSVVV
jgi:uncharacterized protein (TIGR02391 family)